MGGNTAFPYIGVHAKPKKGSAILFYSLKLNGEPDQRTIHGACPILLGTKEGLYCEITELFNCC